MAPVAGTRGDYREALRSSAVLERLAAFDPHVAGTLPLGVDVEDSDIDVLCCAPDPARFATVLWEAFSDHDGFAMHQWTGGDQAVVARFDWQGWPFEIFGSPQPVREQRGWRHFEIERRLLALGGEPLRAAALSERRAGLKTEPAFARVLGLAGDPYEALLTLQRLPDRDLAARLAALQRG